MTKVLLLISVFFLFLKVQAQVEFVSRFEVPADTYDPAFEMMRTTNGIISFRTFSTKAISGKKVFQFFHSDLDLKTKRLIELPIRDNYEMIGYDVDRDDLFLLLSRGASVTADKYILQVDLETNQGFEFDASSLLNLELVEFLVQNKKAIFMGTADSRPALQIYDLDDKSIHTVQGVYGNNTQVLQIRKVPELESLEVVISRRGQYKNRETSILTFDMLGNLVREIKVDQFGDLGQEIMEGLLLADQNYQQVMIGAFGLDRRDAYQGMYIMEINEFGEYQTKLYTLKDFPNFYNYLNEKQKAKRDAEVLKILDKSRIPSIQNVYSIRDVRETAEAYYVYFDHFNVINSRGNSRSGMLSPTSNYRYDRLNRMGYAPTYMDPFISPNLPIQTFTTYTEFRYISAHFAKIAKTGQVIWDNAARYNDFTTSFPEPFGEIAIVGEDLYHVYAENDRIKMSFFRAGEKIFDQVYFDLKLIDENERIKSTDFGTLRLTHWYDGYFLVSGKQQIRYLDDSGIEQTKDVFFLSKFLVNGDLYNPEGGKE
jgi:hypothetical protein